MVSGPWFGSWGATDPISILPRSDTLHRSWSSHAPFWADGLGTIQPAPVQQLTLMILLSSRTVPQSSVLAEPTGLAGCQICAGTCCGCMKQHNGVALFSVPDEQGLTCFAESHKLCVDIVTHPLQFHFMPLGYRQPWAHAFIFHSRKVWPNVQHTFFTQRQISFVTAPPITFSIPLKSILKQHRSQYRSPECSSSDPNSESKGWGFLISISSISGLLLWLHGLLHPLRDMSSDSFWSCLLEIQVGYIDWILFIISQLTLLKNSNRSAEQDFFHLKTYITLS